MIGKDVIDKIFDASRIEEVVGDFVTLKKRGANLLGVCPFHNEKTPSFTVSPAKGIYKCFGCGKGGNSVNFIMDHEQLTYPEALRYLAKKYNIEIEEEEQTPEQQQNQNDRESLFVVSSFAQKYFAETLQQTDEGKSIGLSYFKERGFRDDIIEKFQLGYCPDKWRAFTDAALTAGYKLDYLVKAGLTIVRGKDHDEEKALNEQEQAKAFDRFSGRIMFPIHNVTGRVIAFGGRILKTDKKTAKYVNSPETEIYHKSKVLYGIYFSKKAIIAEDNCYLVEGYTDVISLHQAGIENVVASSGTSLTIEQIRQVKRYTNNITILYDGDNAGIKASFRGIDLILEEGMNVKVLLFPDGEDPDSFSKKISKDELHKFIKENARDFIAFKTTLLYEEVKHDPIKKSLLIKEIIESVAIIPEAITRSVYIKECGRIMDIEEQVLLNELNKIRRKKILEKKKETPAEEDVITGEAIIELTKHLQEKVLTEEDFEYQEKDIIRILLNHGSKQVTVEGEDEEGNAIDLPITVAELVIHELNNDNITFTNPLYQQIFKEFIEGVNNSNLVDEKYFITHPDENISKITIDLLSTPYALAKWDQHGIDVQTEEVFLKKTVLGALYSLKGKKIEHLLSENRKALQNANSEAEMIQLLQQHQQLSEAKKEFNALMGRIVIK